MKRKNVKELSIVSAVAFGILGCIATSMILLLAGTMLIDNAYMQISTGSYRTILIQLLSAFVGCFIAGKAVGEKRTIACGITGGGYLLILMTISMLFLDGLHGQLLWGIVAIGLGCGGGILLNAKKNMPKRKRQVRRIR